MLRVHLFPAAQQEATAVVLVAVALYDATSNVEEGLDAQHNTTSLIPLVNSIKELAKCQR